MSDNRFQIILDVSLVDGDSTTGTSSSSSNFKSSSEFSQIAPVYDKVFVYDIDDITMLSKRRVANITGKNTHSMEIQEFSRFIKEVLSNAGFDPNELKDPINFRNIPEDGIDNSRTLEKYEHIKNTYEAYAKEDIERKEPFPEFDSDWPLLFERWQYAKHCLELVNERSAKSNTKKYANVVLCEDGIAHGAIELAMNRLSSQIDIENIFSTKTRCTETILKRIQKRFGEQCKLVMVTSNEESIYLAQMLLIHVWQIKSALDFESLYSYQNDFWLPTEEEEVEFITDTSFNMASTKRKRNTSTISGSALTTPSH